MSFIACSCSAEDCRINGCRQVRNLQRRTYERLITNPLPNAPATPRGCICPPTSEQTCQSEVCPRKAKEKPA